MSNAHATGYYVNQPSQENGNIGNRRPSDLEQAVVQGQEKPRHGHHHIPNREGLKRFTDRFLRRGKRKIGLKESIYNIATSSFLNSFIIFLPISWILWFQENTHHRLIFAFSFLAIIPLERLFDYCGDQLAHYCGKDLGDLIVVTLNNAVEAALAIILLFRDKFRLLQSTIIGVIVLHLLLIPGTAFMTGGARVISQDLHPHITELNHTLLIMGVISLVLPAAFFAALDRSGLPTTGAEAGASFITDELRDSFLRLSRGIAVILLVMYICSRIYIHNPPGDDNALQTAADAPAALRAHEEMLENEDPEVNQWVCIVVIVIAIGLMAATAEWLVESVEVLSHNLGEEWLGLILLPIVSFAADGTVAVLYFFRSIYHHFFRTPTPPIALARARAIDLSIQFSLFWMPVLILLSWWSHKPLSLLFDLFEIAALVGACFLVNYVTADAKTNWAEGFAMVGFYTMIGLCAWYYPGQREVAVMLEKGSIADALRNMAEGAAEGVAEGAGH